MAYIKLNASLSVCRDYNYVLECINNYSHVLHICHVLNLGLATKQDQLSGAKVRVNCRVQGIYFNAKVGFTPSRLSRGLK